MYKPFLLMGVLVVTLAGCQMNKHEVGEQGDHQDQETKVAFDQIPAPARATLTREAQGTALASVDMEQDKNTTIYEADVVLNGRNYEIKVDAAGNLISKKLDNETGETGEHGGNHDSKDKD